MFKFDQFDMMISHVVPSLFKKSDGVFISRCYHICLNLNTELAIIGRNFCINFVVVKNRIGISLILAALFQSPVYVICHI